jgi:hypothetical protein
MRKSLPPLCCSTQRDKTQRAMSMPPHLDELKPFAIDDWAATVDMIQTFAKWQRKDMSELTAKADESVRLSEELQHQAAEYLRQAEAYRQEAANRGKAAQELEQEGKNTRILAQFLGFDVDAHLDPTPTVLERVRGLRSSAQMYSPISLSISQSKRLEQRTMTSLSLSGQRFKTRLLW